MSYILDALRKADAQRVRDPAHGIHAQGAAVASGPAADGRGPAVWVWSTGVVLLLALAAWYWSSGDAPAPAPAPAATARPIEVARVPPPPATAVLPPPPPTVISAPVQPPPEVRPPAIRKPPKEPAPVAGLPGQSPAAVVPAPAAAPAPAAVPVAATADRTYSLAELPVDVKQALPKLSVSGGVYSANVAQRMLIVNGQVFNEGSEVAPGVVLEQIRPNVALLKFRGLRITHPY